MIPQMLRLANWQVCYTQAYLLAEDISMQSPTNSPPKLPWCITHSGGLFRGQATGNAIEWLQIFQTQTNNESIGPVRGQINIYLSQDDPADSHQIL